MNENDVLGFLLKMKRIAKEARSRRRRCHYKVKTKRAALTFLELIEARNGTLEDAAELMSMHRATLLGWVEQATDPDHPFEAEDAPPPDPPTNPSDSHSGFDWEGRLQVDVGLSAR